MVFVILGAQSHFLEVSRRQLSWDMTGLQPQTKERRRTIINHALRSSKLLKPTVNTRIVELGCSLHEPFSTLRGYVGGYGVLAKKGNRWSLTRARISIPGSYEAWFLESPFVLGFCNQNVMSCSRREGIYPKPRQPRFLNVEAASFGYLGPLEIECT